MAHKKRKAAKPPSRSFQNPWDLFRAAGDSPERLWRWFWPLLAAGFALRAVAALGGNFLLRPDEGMQHLEQAHRLVFGYGFIPWEYQVGARNWLVVLPSVPPLMLAKALGMNHPDQYMNIVEIFHAAFSMSVPLGMFFLARNFYGETSARAALALGCLWHEFVVFAPHALSELHGTALAFAALALLSPAPSRTRMLLAGFLLGAALALRPHYAPFVFVFAAAWVFSLRDKESAASRTAFGVLGGAAAAGVFLASDWLAWGAPGLSILLNLRANAAGVGGLTDGHPLHTHLVNLLSSGGGAGILAAAIGAAKWRRHGLILALALPTLLLHMTHRGQSYSLIFAVVPLLLLIAADETGRALASRKIRQAGIAAALALSLVAAAGFAGKMPQRYRTKGGAWTMEAIPLVGENFYLTASRLVSQLPEEEVGAIVWLAADPIPVGGYYKIHHHVPIYFPALSAHRNLLAGRGWGEVATHIVSHQPLEGQNGIELIHDAGVFKIYKTGVEAESISPPEGYGYDFLTGDGEIMRRLLDEKVIDSPPPPAPFQGR